MIVKLIAFKVGVFAELRMANDRYVKPLSKLIKSVLDKGSQTCTCKVTMTELVEYETFSCQLLMNHSLWYEK